MRTKKRTAINDHLSTGKLLHVGVFCIIAAFTGILILAGSVDNNAMQKKENRLPVSVVPKDKPLIIPYDAGTRIWDVDRIPAFR